MAGVTSAMGQYFINGKVSTRDLALDVFFIAAVTYPRALFSGWLDRRFFQSHGTLRQKMELSGYYLADQWLGAFLYGMSQKAVTSLVPDNKDKVLLERKDLPDVWEGFRSRILGVAD